MSEIERWECPMHGPVDAITGDAALVDSLSGRCPRCKDRLVKVEHVPAGQLAGAVEARRAIRDYEETPGGPPADDAMRALAANALHLGGQ